MIIDVKEGWEVKKLGEVCRFINGRAYSQSELLKDGRYPVLRVGNFYTNRDWYYSDLELPADKYCENGDLLYAWSASFGPKIWKGEKVIYHYHIWKVEPDKNWVSKEFLFQLLEWDTEAIKTAHGTGTTMMHVGKGSIENRLVPIPPLPEQQRIVSILDEAFAAIAQAKANSEQNLKNAKELFESYLQGSFQDGILNSTVGDQILLQRGFDITKTQQEGEGTIPVVSSGGIKSFHNKSMVEGPGVVIGRKGTLGKVFYLETAYWPHDTTLWVKDFKGNNPRFVYYFLKGLDVKSLDSGAANPALNRNQVHPIKVRWSPILEQPTIVQKLDLLSTETKKLELIYRKKIADLEELKKSLLEKAFKGELTSKLVEA